MIPTLDDVRRVGPQPRRLLFATALALAVLLVAVTGALWWRTHLAARAIVQAQGDFLLRELGRRAPPRDGPPSEAQLEELVATHGPEGLLWVGLVTADGEVRRQAGPTRRRLPLTALPEAGTSRLEGTWYAFAPPPLRPLDDGPVDRLLRLPDPGIRPGAPPATASGVAPDDALIGARPVIAFEPTIAASLGSGAGWTFFLTLLAATGLVAAAWHFLQQSIEADAMAEERARRDRLASLGEMSAVLAHEIRNPLAALKGHAQLLVETLPEGRTHRTAERVVRSAIRLERITNGLLDFVRLGALARTATDVRALVRAELDECAAPTTLTADGPVTATVDPDRLRQVVCNLLRNAAEADPDGPIEVTLALDRARLRLTVRDHGPGLPPELGERVFEPFRTTKTQGTGLGLAVCRQIVELHGGTLTAHDAPDGGACFVVDIPT